MPALGGFGVTRLRIVILFAAMLILLQTPAIVGVAVISVIAEKHASMAVA
jgi:hypothetical protein